MADLVVECDAEGDSVSEGGSGVFIAAIAMNIWRVEHLFS